MTLIAYVIPKLRIAKDVVSYMSKKSHFRTPLDSQHAKGAQALLNLHDSTYMIFVRHSAGNSVGKCLFLRHIKS